jgi:WD40 repeat protein
LPAVVFALLLLLILLAGRSGPPTFHERALLQGRGPVAFSPDGATLATDGIGNTILLWDTGTAERKRTLEAPGEVRDLAFSPNGNTIAAGGNFKGVLTWDTRTGGRGATIGETERAVLAFAPSGGTLATGGPDRSDDRTVHLWDLASGQLLRTLKESDASLPERPMDSEERWMPGGYFYVSSVVFSPDGRLLASAHGGHRYVTIKLWDVRTGRLLGHANGMGSGVTQVVFLPGGRTLAAGGDGGEVVFWGAHGGEPLSKVGEPGNHGVAALAVSPSPFLWAPLTRRILATSSRTEGTVLWDVRTGKRLRKLDGSGGAWRGVAFSSDGRLFASASRDGVRLWETASPASSMGSVAAKGR